MGVIGYLVKISESFLLPPAAFVTTNNIGSSYPYQQHPCRRRINGSHNHAGGAGGRKGGGGSCIATLRSERLGGWRFFFLFRHRKKQEWGSRERESKLREKDLALFVSLHFCAWVFFVFDGRWYGHMGRERERAGVFNLGPVGILLGILHQLIKTTTKQLFFLLLWIWVGLLGGGARDRDDAWEVFAVGCFVAVEVDYADTFN